MLAGINKQCASFTSGEYNILRVVAAFPLLVNFNSTSRDVGKRLSQDSHPLAQLSSAAFVFQLTKFPSRRDTISKMLTPLLEGKREKQDKKRKRIQEIEDENDAGAGPSVRRPTMTLRKKKKVSFVHAE